MKFGSLAVAISVFALLGAGAASGQQTWPSKPVRWIVPYAAGGFADIRAQVRSLLATVFKTPYIDPTSSA